MLRKNIVAFSGRILIATLFLLSGASELAVPATIDMTSLKARRVKPAR